MLQGKELFETMRKEMNYERIGQMLTAFDKLHRYTGSEDGERAVDYIVNALEKAGVPAQRLCYDALVSLPQSAYVEVLGENGFKIPAIADVFSTEAELTEAEVFYDEPGALTPLEEQQRLKQYCGKIILAWGGRIRGDFALKARDAGALGIVHISNADTDYIMHGTIGCVWGSPTLDNVSKTVMLPSMGILKKDGQRIIELLQAKPDLKIRIHVKMDTGVRRSSMPVVDIPGKKDEFVLVAGHYDSWYQGITDNAVANAMMVELAIAFNNHRHELERGVRIVWWSGHSDARFAGSTWYSDTHWQELHHKCAAYINLDICGLIDSDKLPFVPVTTNMESFELTSEMIELTNEGKKPEYYEPVVRGADESFWGPGVPLIFMAFSTQPGWWYHTSQDLLDKVDMKMVRRDLEFYLIAALEVAAAKRLPVYMSNYLSDMKNFLAQLEGKLGEDFSLDAVKNALAAAADKIAVLEDYLKTVSDDEANKVYIRIAGDLHRICWTSCSAYEHDPAGGAMSSKPFSALYAAAGVNRDNCGDLTYLCVQTKFRRLCNRLIGELELVCEKADSIMLRR